MTEPLFRLTYEGADADHHVMEMRYLAMSLQGADRITSDAVIVMMTGRPPKRGERAPVVAKVKEPQPGSYEIVAGLQEAAWLLPLGLPVGQQVLAHHISQWWAAVKAMSSGDRAAMEVAMQNMVDLNRDHLAARDAQDVRSHQQTMAFIELIRSVMPSQQKPMEQFVEPMGRTVVSGAIRPTHAPAVSVDAVEAAAIRETGKVVWSDLRPIVLETDGFRIHTSGLSVRNPEREGYLMARVTDPRFDNDENPYTAAAHRRSAIRVLARLGFRASELVQIEVVDFIEELASV